MFPLTKVKSVPKLVVDGNLGFPKPRRSLPIFEDFLPQKVAGDLSNKSRSAAETGR